MVDANESGDEFAEPKKLVRKWWIWLVDEVIRKIQEYKAKRKQEQPADRAARRTAWATVVIAFFTIALACVGYFQLDEMKNSGAESSVQIDRLTHEFRSQVAEMKRQSEEMHDLAVASEEQAKASKRIAEQAFKQATIARDAFEAEASLLSH